MYVELWRQSSEEEEEEEEEEEITGDKKNCVSDLEGNRLLPIGKIVNAIGNSMCCRKCAVSNHKDMMNDFVAFCTEYEDKIKKEEEDKLFYSKVEQLDISGCSIIKQRQSFILCTMEVKVVIVFLMRIELQSDSTSQSRQ